MTQEVSSRELADPLIALGFRGLIVEPGDPVYDASRAVHNGMIDRRPAAIACCVDVADVVAALALARERGMLVAVRGGGHNAGGLGVADDALVIDLAQLDGVRVDPATGLVRVEAGATLGALDHATSAYGLAVPSGILSTTGVAGLTLGGGIGYLSRQFGLTIDNLRSADVVLPDGQIVVASDGEHPDLFWGIRGGGGNFGIVTSFELQARPVADFVAGPMFWPMEEAPAVMRAWDDFIRVAPRELNGFFAFLTVPPAPAFPAELHMRRMCGVVWASTLGAARTDELLAELRAAIPPVLDGVTAVPYAAMNSAFDGIYPPGLQLYWKADFVDELTDDAIAVHCEQAARMPTWQSTMHLYPIDGAVHDVAPESTPWAYRSSRWAQVILGADPDPANADRIRSWAQDYFQATHPYASMGGGAYINFVMDDESPERLRSTYAGGYDRLVEVKRTYDPGNLLRVNQNIAP